MSGQVPLVVTTFRNAPQCAMGPTSPAVEPNVPLVRRRDASPGWVMASDCCAQWQAVVSEEPRDAMHCPAKTVAARGCLSTTGEGLFLTYAYGSTRIPRYGKTFEWFWLERSFCHKTNLTPYIGGGLVIGSHRFGFRHRDR